MPHAAVFIGLLIAFEAAAGLLVLVPGRVHRVTLVVLIAFNPTPLWFGWANLPWALISSTALALLLRADRRWVSCDRWPGQRGERNAVSASAYMT